MFGKFLLGSAAIAAAGLAGPITSQGAPARTAVPGDTVIRSTSADRESVAITVYNQNFGLVREVRSVGLGTGPVAIEFGDVASGIQTETVHVRSLNGDFRILEQNYQYDLLSPQKLLEKYVGKTVRVYRFNPATEQEEVLEAEVLSVHNGTVLRIGDEITYNVPGRLAFPEVPANLISEPTLLWRAQSGRAEQRLEASYLSHNLNWKSDYVMVLNKDDSAADLTGWVTLTNNSGASYENARLKLVAGDVQRLGPEEEHRLRREMMDLAAANVAAPQFSEEGFFEYHLYTLDRPTSVLNNEQKQVTLLESAGFDVRKRLQFYGAAHYYRGQYGEVVSNQKVGVFLEFENTEANRLGMPLPAGVVRVYKEDGSGAQQFIGEDRIDHTPRDETVKVRMGDAFDVVGDRRQMNYTVISRCVSQSTWEVDLRNHKDEDVEVEVIEPIGGDWTMISASHEHTRLDAHTFRFDIDIPARGEAEVRYTVRVRWC